MILVLLIIFVLLLLWGMWLLDDDNGSGILPSLAGGFGVVISLIGTIYFISSVVNLSVVDNKISMYQEENQIIENQIAEAVKQYQEYENEVFTEIAPESYITLVSIYPELKADELVKKQIDVYLENNKKIKELKENKINGDISRWWLYFGG